MDFITVFLIVLIIALAIGNGLLFLFEPKNFEYEKDVDTGPVMVNSSQIGAEPKSNAPLEKKIELAHKRIQDLEQQVGSKDDKLLKKRIELLDDFRSTAEAEIIGLKEILMELQNKHVTVKARTYKKKVSDEDMHKIIYRSK